MRNTFGVLSVTLLTLVSDSALANPAPIAPQTLGSFDKGSCTFNGKKLYGKIQEVTAFPDVKVQKVTAFPDKCGMWEMVTAFPDTKVQFVTAFPDVKIQYVNAFPGI